MTIMLEFVVASLQAVADFMGAEPMIYLFGVIIFSWICKGIKILLDH